MSAATEEERRQTNSGSGRAREDNKENRPDEDEQPPNKRSKTDEGATEEKKAMELLTTRTGGAYIPPAKLRMMQGEIKDKNSLVYQRIAWEALKKSINGLINKVNVSNIVNIVRELFQENLIRGRGLLARSIILSQAASQTFTHVYAGLVAILNTKLPQLGELILKRLISQLKKSFRRNFKPGCMSTTRFLAHLVNQNVVHEVIALEVLTLLLENPTDDSVEIAVGFLKECGQKLEDVTPRGAHAIFERLRSLLQESSIDKRVQYMIEVIMATRKDKFADHPAVIPELDLVEEEDQYTHMMSLDDDVLETEDHLNVFKLDSNFTENEDKYKKIRMEILDEDSSASEGEESADEDEEQEEAGEAGEQMIVDSTETNLVALRRTIYLTIQSSLDFEEAVHKLFKMELKPGQDIEMCHMVLDCCAQQRTYEKFYGLVAQRFCQLKPEYVEAFERMFEEQYETIHRLEQVKLRNVAKLFAHLFYTDAISWGVMMCFKLTEEDTTSSGRVFIKILFQELAEYMGLPKLNARFKDPTLVSFFEGLFPRDNPRNARFSINFFTSIGLGGLTEDLREHLKSAPKMIPRVLSPAASASEAEEESSSSSSEEESSSESESSSSSSESSSSDEDDRRKKKQGKAKVKKEKQTPPRQTQKAAEKGKSKKARKESSSSSSSSEEEDDVVQERKKEKQRRAKEQDRRGNEKRRANDRSPEDEQPKRREPPKRKPSPPRARNEGRREKEIDSGSDSGTDSDEEDPRRGVPKLKSVIVADLRRPSTGDDEEQSKKREAPKRKPSPTVRRQASDSDEEPPKKREAPKRKPSPNVRRQTSDSEEEQPRRRDAPKRKPSPNVRRQASDSEEEQPKKRDVPKRKPSPRRQSSDSDEEEQVKKRDASKRKPSPPAVQQRRANRSSSSEGEVRRPREERRRSPPPSPPAPSRDARNRRDNPRDDPRREERKRPERERSREREERPAGRDRAPRERERDSERRSRRSHS